MAAKNPFAAALDMSWIVSALEPITAFQEGQVDQARVRSLAREITAACRNNRDRVLAAERMLDEYRDILPAQKRDEILRLMAEALMYVQFNGRRVKVVGDPTRILKEH